VSDDTPDVAPEAQALPPVDREARLRALEVARGVAFRHLVARLRGDLQRVLGCRLTGVDVEGGRVELVALDEQGAQAFSDLGVAMPESRRCWFPFVHVAALVAKRKAATARTDPATADQRTS
jgi:hypothetical protein